LFYATPNDHREIVRFVYEETDCQVFEPYSRVNKELRSFGDLEEFDLERPAEASHDRLFLHFISPTVTPGPAIERYELNESAGGGYRYRIDQAGVISLQEGAIRKDIEGEPLDWSDIGHMSERGAWQRSNWPDEMLEQVNWRELERVSRKIRYHISNRLAVAKHRSKPILQDAFRQMRDGLNLWVGPGLRNIESDEIHRK
jgi:hypothetical protein